MRRLAVPLACVLLTSGMVSTSPSAAAPPPDPALCSTAISAVIDDDTSLYQATVAVNDGRCSEIDISGSFDMGRIESFSVGGTIETLTITGTDDTLTGAVGGSEGGLFIDLDDTQSLVISGLNFTGFENRDSGGAIIVSGGNNVTVENSTFSANTTTPIGGEGGAIAITGSQSVSIVNSTFSGNSADGSGGKGGAIAIGSVEELTIESSTFTNNSADTAGSGGALHLSGTFDTEIIDSTFDLNTAMGSGGAIDSQVVGSLRISGGSTFDHNTAGNAGGAIHHINALVSEGSIFTSNSAPQGGAVAATVLGPSVGSVTSTDDSFISNEATVYDGGAIISSSTFTGAGSHFEDNTAVRDGGALVACPVNDVGSTFQDNSAVSRGGAMYCGANSASMTHVLNGTHFENNGAINDDTTAVAAGGGAIWTNIALTSDDSTSFVGNRSESLGGAILIVAPDRLATGATPRNISLSDTIFENNEAQSGSGGAIQVSGWGPLTISGGRFGGSGILGNSAAQQGGAIFTDDSITASDAIFEGNSSGGFSGDAGGAISAGGAVDLTNMRFINNSATQGSGGAVNVFLTFTDRGSVFESNSTDDASGSGGAVYAWGDVSLTGSEFTNNESAANAGALSVGDSGTRSNAEIEDAQFIGNVATYVGGAVQVYGNLDVTDSLFRANEAGQSGGGVNVGRVATISSSTFRGNHSGSNGGAVNAWRLTALTSSFIENNSTFGGSGAYVSSAAEITNSTFYKNSSPDSSEGGALAFDSSVTPATLSFSTIVSDDTGTTPLIFWSGDNALASTPPISLRGSVLAPGLGRSCAWFGTGNMPLASTTSGSFATDGTCDSPGVATTDDADLDFPLALTTDDTPGQQVLIPGSGSILNSYTPSLDVTTDQRGSSRPEYGFTSVGAVQVGSTSFSGPQNVSASSGSNATFTVSASPSLGGGATYQWQSSSDGVSWSNITGNSSAQTAALTLRSVSLAQSGLQVRARITSTADGPLAPSRTATLTVSGSSSPDPSPTESSQPSGVTTPTPGPSRPVLPPSGVTGLLINGQVTPLKSQARARGRGLTLRAGPVEFTLRSQTARGKRVPLAEDGSLILARRGDVPMTGEGLAPNSTVNVSLFSDPISLGSTRVGADGSFRITPVIPASITLGTHTLQLRGNTRGGDPFVLTVGVTVDKPAVALGVDPVIRVRPAPPRAGAPVAVIARGVQARCLVTFNLAKRQKVTAASKRGLARVRLTVPKRSARSIELRVTVGGPRCNPIAVTRTLTLRR